MGILSGLSNLLKSGIKGLGKSAWGFAKGIANQTLDATSQGGSGSNITVDSILNPATQAINGIKESVRNSESGDLPNKPLDEPKYTLPDPPQPSTTVSYKNLPDVHLHSDSSKAVDEFIRHNREVERLMKEDIEKDEKLGRDKFGNDILAQERAEAYRKQLIEQNENEIKRRKELEERLQEDERNRQLSEKSKGSLEDGSKLKETESPGVDSVESSSGFGLPGKGLLSGLGGMLTGVFLPKLAKIFISPLKGLTKLGKKTWSGVKNVGKLISSGTTKLLSGIKNILPKVTNPVKKLIPKIAQIGSQVKGFGGKIAKNISNKLAPVIDTVKKPIEKVAQVASKKFINPVLSGVKNVGKKLLDSRLAKAVKFMAHPKALGKLGKKMLSKLTPALPRLAKKLGMTMAKSGGKSALKQVPLLGAAIGIGEAISDITKGDYVGAGLAALAGIAPTINLVAPGLGTAISMGAIGADIARDVLNEPMKKAIKVFDESTPESIMNEPETDLSTGVNIRDGVSNKDELDKMAKPTESTQTETKNSDLTVNITEEQKAQQERYGVGNPQSQPQGMVNSTSGGVYSGNGPLLNPSTQSTRPARVSGTERERIVQAMNYFMRPDGLGLTKNQAAGLVGNLMAESRLNPSSINREEKFGGNPKIKYRPQGYGAGLPHWSNNRKPYILNYVNKKYGTNYRAIEEIPFDKQLDAVEWEFKTKYPSNLRLLKTKDTPYAAADIVLRGYENGSNGKLMSVDSISGGYGNWTGGYNSMMVGSNGRATFAKSAVEVIDSHRPSTSGSKSKHKTDILHVDVPSVTRDIFNHSNYVPAVNVPTKPKSVGPVKLKVEDKPTQESTKKSKNQGKSRSGQKNSLALRGGDFSPTINQGGTSIVNNYYITNNDPLSQELHA